MNMRLRAILLALLLSMPGRASALDWSIYPTDPGKEVPGTEFLQLSITTVDSVHIAAWYIPAQDSTETVLPGRHPGLLILPRENETLDRRARMAASLARRGFSVLTLDHRGYGASDPFPAEAGALIYPEYLIDALSGYGILRKRAEVDTTRMAVMGESRGAVLALAVARNRPEVRAVAAVSPPRDWKSLIESMKRDHPDIEFFVPKSWNKSNDPNGAIRRFNGSILFATGDMDTRTPVWMAEELYKNYPRPKELWVIPAAGHSGERSPEAVLGQEYYDRLAAFFLRELAKPPHRGWPDR